MEWLKNDTDLKSSKALEDYEDNSEKRNFHVLRDALIQQAKWYKEETAKMESIRKKLQLLKNELNPYTQTELDKLTSLQEKYETKQFDSESIGLSHADRLRKQTNYVTKIKSCNKVYHNLIDKLCKEIKTAKGEFQRSEKKITNITTVTSEDVKMLQVKIERYEKEILKFEFHISSLLSKDRSYDTQKRYPWLSDPQYNLQNISKETETLLSLRKEKVKLTEELCVYRGLKPDINEAAQQLADLKKEYDSML